MGVFNTILWPIIFFASLVAAFTACNYLYYNARGRDISAFLDSHYGMVVPPDQARWFTITVTTTDVQFSPEQLKITIFE